MPGKVVISGQRRVLDDFFKVDEFDVSHRQADGTMSAVQRRLVFERGDAVGVLLFNAERQSVVLVEQFRLPALIGRRRDDPLSDDGWLVEAVAGMIDKGESPDAAALREVFEETGYRVRELTPIGRFFSSPGGTSERIFLYFAEVADRDRAGPGGGIDDEDVRIVDMHVADLFARLNRGELEDPKLMIAASWLRERLRKRR
jgi:nudix-type nucleoside diphosphatase (YffH/AdpP family)